MKRGENLKIWIKEHGPWNKGIPHSAETKEKLRLANLGKKLSEEHKRKIGIAGKGRKHTIETKMKISMKHLGMKHSPEACKNISIGKTGKKLTEEHRRNMLGKTAGKKNGNWIKDRSKLAKRQERNDTAYKEWRRQVWLRDNFKCKIGNPDCKGKIEAHHILGWSSYPELRYQINNGITLCHAHHPKKRSEEKRLSPYFQELVSVSK